MSGFELAAICLFGLLAALTQSLSGFGFSLLIVPPLSILVGPKDAVVLANTLGLVVNGVTVTRMHDSVDWKLGMTLFLSAAVGMPFGLIVLVLVDPAALQAAIAVLVIVSTILIWRGFHIRRTFRIGDIGVGLLSGLLNTSTSMSGPPVVLYLQGRRFSPLMFRATLNAYFLASGAFALCLFLVGGRIDGAIVLATVLAAPGLLLGWFVGHAAFHRIDPSRFRAVVLVVLLASAALALVSAFSR